MTFDLQMACSTSPLVSQRLVRVCFLIESLKQLIWGHRKGLRQVCFLISEPTATGMHFSLDTDYTLSSKVLQNWQLFSGSKFPILQWSQSKERKSNLTPLVHLYMNDPTDHSRGAGACIQMCLLLHWLEVRELKTKTKWHFWKRYS